MLSQDDMNACWNALALDSAEQAYQSVWALISARGKAVSYLADRLVPASLPDSGELGKLIAELESDDYLIRERATRQLEMHCELAHPILRKALQGKQHSEMRRRIDRILNKSPNYPPTQMRTLRAIMVLEQIGTPAALQVLERLSKGTPESRITKDAIVAAERLRKKTAVQR
jgi:hypothetical protein